MTKSGMRMNGTKFEITAKDLEMIVQSNAATSSDAMNYLGFIAELGPSFYTPSDQLLRKALNITEKEIDLNNDKGVKRSIYGLLEDVTRVYGLDVKADEYKRKNSLLMKDESANLRKTYGEAKYGFV